MKKYLLPALVLLSLSACSPFYVLRAAYEQSKILLGREDIKTVLKDDSYSEDERRKLALVLDAREFAIGMGLTPGRSFTKYTKVHKDTLAWILAASKPEAFTLHTWWFPFIGTVPYKGYFDKSDADAEAAELQSEGYESWVRGTEALSTLGWFNDPVLSTTLKNSPQRIADTVIHETLHRTIWVADHVDFNESLANFVGGKGMAQFFAARAAHCDPANCADAQKDAIVACGTFKSDLALAAGVETLYNDLNALYQSDISREEKLAKRTEIFERDVKKLKADFPRMTALANVNNAEIIQLKLYMTRLAMFEELYREKKRSWSEFLAAIRTIADGVARGQTKDPFAALSEWASDVPLSIDDEVCQ